MIDIGIPTNEYPTLQNISQFSPVIKEAQPRYYIAYLMLMTYHFQMEKWKIPIRIFHIL